MTFEFKLRSLHQYCAVEWPTVVAGWVGIGVAPRDSGVVVVEVEVAVLSAELRKGVWCSTGAYTVS